MFPETLHWQSPRVVLACLLCLLLVMVPPLTVWLHQGFYLTFATRILIYALAATGLNIVLGYGGLVSMGHSLFIGIGAYAVGISSFHGLTNGWAQLGFALGVTFIVSLVTGAVSLRTRSIAFIMITLAFGQMFYFLAVSLKQYGGDDGLPIDNRSDFGSFLSLDGKFTLYYLCLAILAIVMYLTWRTMNGRFGMVIRGFQSNERRMLAAGYPRMRYQLTAYVASALVCALAGMLLANLTSFASPSYLSWQASGDMLLIVVLGGMATVVGPVVGAIVYLGLEEILSSLTQHWMAIIGPFILVVAVVSARGLWGGLVHRHAMSLKDRLWKPEDKPVPRGPSIPPVASMSPEART
jgi:branched-chain amino acid transport system permease protein